MPLARRAPQPKDLFNASRIIRGAPWQTCSRTCLLLTILELARGKSAWPYISSVAMPSHKNQHFVPRCHLKPFTTGCGGVVINVYNVDRGRGIRNAPVKGQCSGNYFYGENLRLEKWLQGIEGRYGQLMRDITAPGYKINETDRDFLRRFMFLQYSRTETAARRRALGTADMHDAVFSNSEHPEEIDLSTKSIAQECMITFAKLMHMVDDLKVCLVRSEIRRSFVTSDDPSIFTNRWYIQKAKGDGFGLGSAGVLLMLPLTPQIVALCYDGDVYSIENREGWTSIRRSDDVLAINEQQFLKCSSNIYFSNWNELEEIKADFTKSAPGRLPAWQRVTMAALDRSDAWAETYKVVPREEVVMPGKYFVHMRAIYPRPQRWPSIIRYRSKPIIFTNGSATGFLRRRGLDEDSSAFSAPYRKLKVR